MNNLFNEEKKKFKDDIFNDKEKYLKNLAKKYKIQKI